jgi:MoxR-like ATPase
MASDATTVSKLDLSTDQGLREACQQIGPATSWPERPRSWLAKLADTLHWVAAADESERSTRDFQWRLWEENYVAATGQGHVPIEKALDNEGFRRWLAHRSLDSCPVDPAGRVRFLTSFKDDLVARLEGFKLGKVPHLKIFRVMAAFYPQAMTTIASRDMLAQLAKAMGAERGLYAVQRHVWVRQRIDGVLGPVQDGPMAEAERLTIPWLLYERFVAQGRGEISSFETPAADEGDEPLRPLPAALRRRGLTSIKGMFAGVLSTLQFIGDGVTRHELLDHLRAASPDAQANSLGMVINVLESELGVIRKNRERYVLTQRGAQVLSAQDAMALSDWVLTQVLGPDAAMVALRDRGPMPPSDLIAVVKSLNPGWTSNVVPQAIIGWLRSFGAIETIQYGQLALSGSGRVWAASISWEPESLPDERPIASVVDVALPPLPAIVESVQRAGHFPAELIASLHAALWSHDRRHFAILTGLSGSGKTMLAREYAKALTITPPGEPRLLTVPVQPGWYDPSGLLGYVNPLRSSAYVRQPFLDFLIAAASDPSRPYVVVLDEMNLSHPEQYMAPLLSAMETEESIPLHSQEDALEGVPASIAYPRNLALIGTVNMDETTHGLSDKVLDRAFVLDFWTVDLDAYPHWRGRNLSDAHAARAREVLVALMAALEPVRLHFGWRVIDGVLDYLEATSAGGTLTFDAALDGVIYAKVLPKLRGEDTPRFRDALEACSTALAGFGLRRSRDKVEELKRDLQTTGSARFWR